MTSEALVAFARQNDAVAFDHELVPPEMVAAMESVTAVRPNGRALRFAADKAFQRRALSAHVAVPRHVIVTSPSEVDSASIAS
jgi:5-(carboxyamino)imidazole ribonucleotide synthase